jgi:hypothetical protein
MSFLWHNRFLPLCSLSVEKKSNRTKLRISLTDERESVNKVAPRDSFSTFIPGSSNFSGEHSLP